MKGNRDDVVSSYVRMKIKEWKASGRELQELARIAKFAKSTPSQVLIGTGVGDITGPKFARAFGFASYDAMRSAAWEWRRSQSGDSETLIVTDAMGQAASLAIGMGQGTQAQIDTIFAAYAHARFRERDRDWWLQTLLAELAREREILREDKRQRDEIHAEQKLVRQAQARRRPKPKDPTPSPGSPIEPGPYTSKDGPSGGAHDSSDAPQPEARRRVANDRRR